MAGILLEFMLESWWILAAFLLESSSNPAEIQMQSILNLDDTALSKEAVAMTHIQELVSACTPGGDWRNR